MDFVGGKTGSGTLILTVSTSTTLWLPLLFLMLFLLFTLLLLWLAVLLRFDALLLVFLTLDLVLFLTADGFTLGVLAIEVSVLVLVLSLLFVVLNWSLSLRRSLSELALVTRDLKVEKAGFSLTSGLVLALEAKPELTFLPVTGNSGVLFTGTGL